MKVVLTLEVGEPSNIERGTSFELDVAADRPAFIGRAPGVELFVMEPSVGKRVVALEIGEDGRAWVRDLGSGGGSAIDFGRGRVERPSCALEHGALLYVGAVGFRVALPEERS